jgi:hypothetical protein
LVKSDRDHVDLAGVTVKETSSNGGPSAASDSELVDLDTYLESDHDPGANIKGILKF